MVQNTGKLQWHPAFDAAGHTDCEKRRQLESEENLRTDLEGSEEINELVRRYEERKSSHYYQLPYSQGLKIHFLSNLQNHMDI